jgi:hypothetical protein
MQFEFLFHFFHINQRLKKIIKIIRTKSENSKKLPDVNFFVLFLRVIWLLHHA